MLCCASAVVTTCCCLHFCNSAASSVPCFSCAPPDPAVHHPLPATFMPFPLPTPCTLPCSRARAGGHQGWWRRCGRLCLYCGGGQLQCGSAAAPRLRCSWRQDLRAHHLVRSCCVAASHVFTLYAVCLMLVPCTDARAPCCTALACCLLQCAFSNLPTLLLAAASRLLPQHGGLQHHRRA